MGIIVELAVRTPTGGGRGVTWPEANVAGVSGRQAAGGEGRAAERACVQGRAGSQSAARAAGSARLEVAQHQGALDGRKELGRGPRSGDPAVAGRAFFSAGCCLARRRRHMTRALPADGAGAPARPSSSVISLNNQSLLPAPCALSDPPPDPRTRLSRWRSPSALSHRFFL